MWLAYAAWDKKILSGMSNKWRPRYTTEFSEIRFAEDTDKFEVLDLEGDIDEELSQELNEAVAKLRLSK